MTDFKLQKNKKKKFNGTRRAKQAQPRFWPNTQSAAVTIAGADAHEHSKYIVTAIKYSEACN